MKDLTAVLLIAAMAFVLRAAPLFLLNDTLPLWLRRWLSYLTPAMLAAMSVPAILAPSGRPVELHLGWNTLPYVVAAIAASFWRNLLLALALGIAAMVTVQILLAPGPSP